MLKMGHSSALRHGLKLFDRDETFHVKFLDKKAPENQLPFSIFEKKILRPNKCHPNVHGIVLHVSFSVADT